MKHKDAERILRQYCTSHRIRLFYPDSNPGRNEGGQSGRTIWLGEFDDADCLVAAFFHEVGHIIDGRKGFHRNHRVTIFERELRAWAFGLEEMHNFGIGNDAKAIGYMMDRLSRYASKEIDAAPPMHPGNAAALREALEGCMHEMCERCDSYMADNMQTHKPCPGCVIVDKARAALAAPARNCDRFKTLDEAREAFQDLRGHKILADVELWDSMDEAGALVRWLFAPAEGKEPDNG